MKISAAGKVRLILLVVLIIAVIIGLSWHLLRGFWPKREIRNVLLISIDTCRADHLSCYGYPRKTTINIDKLADEGVLFANAYSPVPMTLPSHSSMLTGTIPPYHGVHDNLEYRLGESNVTLAEILGQRGFATGAVISAFVLDTQFGINQGFDYYNDRFEKPITTGIHHRRGDESTRFALKWLGEHREEKFFFFLHYYDPHMHYDPPEPFASEFRDNLYAGEIAFTDYCIGQVVQRLKDLGLYDSTLIIITSDHGEMLGEHGEDSHDYFIYQSAIKVPLIFKLPDGRQGKVSDPVGIIDIVPTVCKLLGIEVPGNLQGRDLSGYFGGEPPSDPQRQIYCECLTSTKYDANPLLGLVSGQWKFIQTTRPELYDLIKDPHEKDNLADQQPQRVRIFQDHLKQMLTQSFRKGDSDSKNELDAQAIERLETLGYTAGKVKEDFEFNQTKDDPKDLIKYHLKYQLVPNLITAKKYEEAQKICQELIQERPGFLDPYLRLGKIAMDQEDFTSALTYITDALRLDPNSYESHDLLARTYQGQGQVDMAIKHFEEAIRLRPQKPMLHNNLGILLAQLGKFDEAITHFNEALKIDPKIPQTHQNLGKAMLKLNQPREAVKHYLECLALSPAAEKVDVHNVLAKAYYLSGQLDQAHRHLYRALKFRPDWPMVLNQLARIKSVFPDGGFYDPSAAVKLASRACALTGNKNALYLSTLAGAYAAGDKFPEAIATGQKALDLVQSAGNEKLAEQCRTRLELYKAGKAYRQGLAPESK